MFALVRICKDGFVFCSLRCLDPEKRETLASKNKLPLEESTPSMFDGLGSFFLVFARFTPAISRLKCTAGLLIDERCGDSSQRSLCRLALLLDVFDFANGHSNGWCFKPLGLRSRKLPVARFPVCQGAVIVSI